MGAPLKIVNYEKIGVLDLLKFILVAITFLFHWNIHFGIVYSCKILNKFINSGAIAMSGFFILSGFLLYYIYSNKNFADFNYLKKFYLKRIIKIFPSSYLIALLLFFLTEIFLHESTNWTIVLMQIIPLQAYFANLFGEGWNGGFWFVSVLIFLYFLFPYLSFLVKSIKNLLLLSVGVYILGIFPTIVNCYYPNFSIYHLPYFRICEFMAGLIISKIVLNSKKTYKMALLYSFLVLTIIFIAVGLLHSNNFFHHVKFSSNYMNYDIVLLILFPALIFFLVKIKNNWFLKIVNNKIVSYLGTIAYSFFLTQMVTLFIVKNFIKVNNYFGMSGLEIISLSFLLNFILAILLYEFFEKPVVKMLSEYLLN